MNVIDTKGDLVLKYKLRPEVYLVKRLNQRCIWYYYEIKTRGVSGIIIKLNQRCIWYYYEIKPEVYLVLLYEIKTRGVSGIVI